MSDLYRMLTEIWSPGTTPEALIGLIRAKTMRLAQQLISSATDARAGAQETFDALEQVESKVWETWEVRVTDDPAQTLMGLLTHPEEIALFKLLTEGED